MTSLDSYFEPSERLLQIFGNTLQKVQGLICALHQKDPAFNSNVTRHQDLTERAATLLHSEAHRCCVDDDERIIEQQAELIKTATLFYITTLIGFIAPGLSAEEQIINVAFTIAEKMIKAHDTLPTQPELTKIINLAITVLEFQGSMLDVPITEDMKTQVVAWAHGCIAFNLINCDYE